MADRTEDKPAGIKPAPAAPVKPVAAKPAPAKPVAAVPAPAKVSEPKPVVATPKAPEPKTVVAAPKIEAPAKPAPVAAKPVPAPTPKPAPVAVMPKPAPKPAPVPAKPVVVSKPVTEGKSVMATSINPNFTAFIPTPENLQSAFGDFQARSKAQLEKGAKLVEDMGEFAKGNVEAVMTSGRVAVKGAETIGQDAAEYSKKSFESASAAFKSMVAAKSPTELFTLQSDYARKSFDTAVAEASKFSEAWLKLAGDIVQPLSTRVAVAADKFKATVN